MEESRPQQTRHIAQRIDITYHRRPTWFKLWRRWVAVLTVVAVGILIAVAAVSMLHGGRAQRWLNPGPVSSAHAHFENDCAQCHDNGGKAGFSKTVSDSACLKCHDAAVHAKSANQFVASNAMHSSNCTACHVEHRGHAALAAVDNRLCSQCHGDLNNHLEAGRVLPAGFDPHVTQFAIGNHPAFGRQLLAAGVPLKMPATPKSTTQPWLPNLHLKFNHATHMDPGKVQTKLECGACHVPIRPDPKSLLATGSMQPVNFDQNCRSCHKLQFEKSGVLVLLPHTDLQIAKGPLMDLEFAVRKKISDPGKVKSKTDEILDSLSDTISAAYDKDAKRVKSELKIKSGDKADALDAMGDAAAKDRAAMAEFIAANKSTTACSKCHEMTGDPAMVVALKTQWKVETKPLATVPTGIEKTPKRWFVSSRFDHEAHRDRSCMSCHAGMDKDNDDPLVRLPTMESCVTCHHADTSTSRGATAACVACHDYHAR